MEVVVVGEVVEVGREGRRGEADPEEFLELDLPVAAGVDCRDHLVDRRPSVAVLVKRVEDVFQPILRTRDSGGISTALVLP